MTFDHIGLITDTKKDDEDWVESSRVWVTSPVKHPFNVEWLRYEPDSPIEGPVRDLPHVAFRVDSIETASAGMKVLLEPFEVGGFVRVGFYQADDGAVVEFMEYLGDENTWFGTPETGKEG
jgi:hypothetical protein